MPTRVIAPELVPTADAEAEATAVP
jgi:hypothetical protein